MIRSILKTALTIAEGHIAEITKYFKQENIPVPQGFNEDDVNLKAFRLFSDSICLTYTYIMSVNGLAGYAAALTTNLRRDIRDYFVECQSETMELFNKSLDLLLEKGIVSRPPVINLTELKSNSSHSFRCGRNLRRSSAIAYPFAQETFMAA